MSIWCSYPEIGFDLFRKRPRKLGKGQVRGYASGWSNHYPNLQVEKPAAIDLACIAPHCVPGHEDHDGMDRDVGPWLRLGLTAARHNFHNPREIIGEDEATVVMDEAAVRELVEALTYWLDKPKVRPQ